jgi:RimJ/RimL family protein N-acetyltransferase
MSIPITRIKTSPAQEADIRNAVRAVRTIETPNGTSRVLTPDDTEALFRYFVMPEVSAPIYTIEKPVTRESVARAIEAKCADQAAGTGLLSATFNDAGEIISHLDHIIWPDWSAAEFGGSRHPDFQSQGGGRAGIFSSTDWVFKTLKVELLCFTAALDNIRSIRLIDAMGMRRMGEITSHGPAGATRQSLVWEMSVGEWRAFRSDVKTERP